MNQMISHDSLLGECNLLFMVGAVCLRGMENNLCVHVPYVLRCVCQRICLCVIKRIYDASGRSSTLHISKPACALVSLPPCVCLKGEGAEEGRSAPCFEKKSPFLICHKMYLSTKRDFLPTFFFFFCFICTLRCFVSSSSVLAHVKSSSF